MVSCVCATNNICYHYVNLSLSLSLSLSHTHTHTPLLFLLGTAIVAEFCIQLLTGPCRPSMKPVVYYSGMVLVYSVVIGR